MQFRHAVAALALFAAAAFAQDTRARVQGIVTDSSQAVVAGATVTLTNDATSVSTVQQTGPTGQYVFDLVLPGTYTVAVELQGFRKFVQKNVLVQSRGDVTVNAVLEVGNVAESVTVEASPVAVQFNSSTMALTLDTKMANDLPIIHRNPFLLVSLNPAVVIRSSTEQSPFHHWAATQFDVGGNTSTKNDIIVDGSPSMASEKSSYTPAMDAVTEVNLQQNAVDAEFGHSAGGILSVNMKSGTNAYHGTAYYLGRNPKLNAVADSLTHRANLTRNHVWGGTIGHPVLKNKLFNFFSYEAWRTMEPRAAAMTLPTAAERQGDFSASRNIEGGLRTIYDPFTTRVNPDGTASRTPFPGNRIPASQIDSASARFMQDIWQPNLPGGDVTGANNYRAGFAERIKYWNLSDRADWNLSEKWRVFGRYSMFKTYVAQDDYTGSRAQPVTGSERHSWNVVGDIVWTINPTTIFNLRGSYNRIFDSFAVESAKLKEGDLAAFWPSAWYKPYLAELPAIYYPGLTVRQGPAANSFGRTGFWYQDPDTYTFQSKISKNHGKHYYKVGGEYRKQRVLASRPRNLSFDFRPELTSSTHLLNTTRTSGDAWATFLLGALDQNSSFASIPLQRPELGFIGLYVHDDFKISKRLTLNFGLRYEYQTAMRDPEDRISRFLDLLSPIPEFQGAGQPRLPAEALALRTAAPTYNGAWVFTDSDNRSSWNPQNTLFMPRVGFAFRANDRTAFRFGYARYLVPAHLTDALDILGSVPYPGFDAITTTIGPIAGVPQQRLRDPYPGGLVPVVGKSLGRYTGMGGSTTWYNQDFRVGVNDRINFTVEREMPWRLVTNLTWFLNFGHDHPYRRDLNVWDPRIGYEQKTAIDRAVPNPFYNLLPADKMPGQLRTQRTIAVRELLRPYPQYSSLAQTLNPGVHTRYQALQLQVQRPFVNGFNLVFGYNYNRERNEEFYDELDFFLNDLTYQDAQNPRHRITGAAIYQLPFGRGRKFMNSAHRVMDAALGGWAVSGIYSYNSGAFLRFGSAIVSGDPRIDNPTRDRMFDTSVFKPLPSFTRRSNPLQYPGVLGPRFSNLDLTLAKEFKVTERVGFELRMEAYNATNSFMGDNPVTNINSGQFGRVVAQKRGYFGRQFQYSGRLRW
ncbi:MAG: carboxypeptidase regulatory-like domain-containing protein [Acidobacteria bacterium]|nr:carboxypeptidase regulatory-like domain-containing protein [Acidobacteriota bacterium]